MGRLGRKSGDTNYEVRVEKVQGHIPEIVFRYSSHVGRIHDIDVGYTQVRWNF